MLVFTRKLGERVVLAENIVVTVLTIRGQRVRLGFAAPADVAIRRGEIAFGLPEPNSKDSLTHPK
jgi:carbon storage regulator